MHQTHTYAINLAKPYKIIHISYPDPSLPVIILNYNKMHNNNRVPTYLLYTTYTYMSQVFSYFILFLISLHLFTYYRLIILSKLNIKYRELRPQMALVRSLTEARRAKKANLTVLVFLLSIYLVSLIHFHDFNAYYIFIYF